MGIEGVIQWEVLGWHFDVAAHLHQVLLGGIRQQAQQHFAQQLGMEDKHWLGHRFGNMMLSTMVYSTSAALHPCLVVHKSENLAMQMIFEIYRSLHRHCTDLIRLHSSRLNSQRIRQVGQEIRIQGRYIPKRLTTIHLGGAKISLNAK
jgi:hypothetical protein